MSSRLSGCLRHALPIFSLAFAGVGCGDNKPPLPMVENYAAAWQQALPPDLNGVGAAPTELRWQVGTLYYRNRDVPSTIVALPVGPGVAPAPQVVSNEDSFRIWVEGDQVLYSQSETLKAVPTGGGPPVTVLQGPDSFGISGSQRLEVAVQDLDALDAEIRAAAAHFEAPFARGGVAQVEERIRRRHGDVGGHAQAVQQHQLRRIGETGGDHDLAGAHAGSIAGEGKLQARGTAPVGRQDLHVERGVVDVLDREPGPRCHAAADARALRRALSQRRD